MKITIKRLHKTDNSTIGELSVDGKFECYTLEVSGAISTIAISLGLVLATDAPKV